mmetsp:Transcript_45134/g.96823  ORF Transcript_45134/g.96823 Transcript_45134/m.96823 type:complete len:108 (-) Transcript_45134:85-408(-)
MAPSSHLTFWTLCLSKPRGRAHTRFEKGVKSKSKAEDEGETCKTAAACLGEERAFNLTPRSSSHDQELDQKTTLRRARGQSSDRRLPKVVAEGTGGLYSSYFYSFFG